MQHNNNNKIKSSLALLWVRLSSKLPLWTHRSLSCLIGWLFWLFPSNLRHVTLTNIRYCYRQLRPKQQLQLAKNSLKNTILTALEISSIWRDPLYWIDNKVNSVQGQELLNKAITKQKGVIVIMPHLGNWELLNLYLAKITPIVSLYNPPKIPALGNYIKEAREKTGAKLVATNNHGVSQLLKHLRSGGMTCILPDHVPSKSNGFVSAPFFGKHANTMTLVNGLAKKTGCTILCAYAMREGSDYKIFINESCDRLSNNDSYVSACGLNDVVEKAINFCPEQYQWSYKRFKYQTDAYS